MCSFTGKLKITSILFLLPHLLMVSAGCFPTFGPYDVRYERIQTIATDSDGNVFVVGEFPETVDFDPGPGVFELTPTGSTDYFISKFDPDGNFLWAGNMGGRESWCDIMSLHADQSGNVLLTGQIWGTVDLDPGPGEFEYTAALPNASQRSSRLQSSDAFLAKIDPDGNLIWAVGWGANYTEVAMSVAVDIEGNSFVTGGFWTTVDFDPGSGEEVHTATPVSAEEEEKYGEGGLMGDGNADVYLSKFDPDGNFLWARTWGASKNDRGKNVVVDENGNPLVNGWFSETVDFDPGPGVDEHQNDNSLDLFLTKYDSDGNFLWASSWTGSSYDYLTRTNPAGVVSDMDTRVSNDGNGNTFMQGRFFGTVDLDPGSGVDEHTSAGTGGFYLIKFDQSGNFSWARSWSGPEGPIGSENPPTDADVYNFMHGRESGPSGLMQGGPGSGGGTFSEDYDLIFSRFDTDGNFSGAATFGGNGAWDYYHVATDSNDNILISGTFTGTTDLDPGPGVDERTPNGVYDLFLTKFDSEFNALWTVTWGQEQNDVVEVYD